MCVVKVDIEEAATLAYALQLPFLFWLGDLSVKVLDLKLAKVHDLVRELLA